MDAEERGLDKYNEALRRIAGIEAREYTTTSILMNAVNT